MTAGFYIAVIVLGYLLGSIPFGLIIAKMVSKKDIRTIGSGKIGMTNVMRAAGKKAAAASLFLDVVKGVLAVVFAGLIVQDNPETARVIGGLAAIAGHTWSVFLGFKGGRGVATFMGGIAGMYWPAAIIGGICVLGLGFRSRYMSLGSITGSVLAFVYTAIMSLLEIDFLAPAPAFEYLIYAMVGCIFVYIMHRDNISRLINGTERKIDDTSPPGPEPSRSTLK